MKNNEKIVFRHELKYLISDAEAEYLRHLLSRTMIKDTYSKMQDYYIRSLYLDTIDNRDLEEKILGTSERRKIRLRTYDLKSERVKLEIKNKQDSYSTKETITITAEDAKALIDGNVEVLLPYENRVANKAYAYMKRDVHVPAIIIDYEREAYMLPVENVRVTFDKKVRAVAGKAFWAEDNPMVQVITPGMCILEVKYDGFLPPHITNVLSSVTMQNMSISKYAHSRMMFI